MLTEAKAIMVEQGRSTAESYLVEMMQARIGEFSAGVAASPFYALCERIVHGAPMGVRIPQAALLHAFREAGWVDCGHVATREYQTKKHLFCAPDMVGVSKSELRRMVEQTPAPAAVRLVK
jgi:hypothetical protein